MNIKNVSADVRIIKYDSPFDTQYDVRVEIRKDGAWETHWETNSLSNDLAYSDAENIARIAALLGTTYRD